VVRNDRRGHGHGAVFGAGMALLLIGLFLPRDWYDALPIDATGVPVPIKGVTLLQISLATQGLVLLWLAMRRVSFVRLQPHEHLAFDRVAVEREALSRSTSLWLLGAITCGALALRLLRLDSDLWLDEIESVLSFEHMPVLQVLTTYSSSNNHLLNTLLMKLSLALPLHKESAARLPAMLFGVAAIPTLYWTARLALSRAESLCAALLLATSYHHIFFSQNARGYTAYLFFSLLASASLVKALQHDRPRYWILFIAATFLNFASLLNSVFVFASHVIVGAVALAVIKARGASSWPMFWRLFAVFLVSGFLVLDLYITVVPQVYAYTQSTYTDPATGFVLFSSEFWNELLRGLSSGMSPPMLLAGVPAVVLAAAGLVMLFRRQWALASSLVLPGILTAGLLLVQGLSVSPRFFLLWLPLGILAAVRGVFAVVGWACNKLQTQRALFAPALAAAMVLFASAASLATLRHYYAVPKQAYRASLEYIAAVRTQGEPIIAAHLMEKGYRFYGESFGFVENADFFSVRSVAALEAVLAGHRDTSSIIVTTLPRALRLGHPDLYARITENWTIVRTFPGTIGDGEISVWRQKRRN
jgi:mannosyltransferase